MKLCYSIAVVAFAAACSPTEKPSLKSQLEGTWELIDAQQIRKDSIVHTIVPGTKMIKIINGTHFAFLNHDQRADSDTTKSTAYFVAGGGTYFLEENRYKEHLEYCSAREYEGNDFPFDIEIKGDTLYQRGVEALKDLGIGAENVQIVEIYRRTPTAVTR